MLVVLGSLETLEIKEKKVYPDSLASPELKDHLVMSRLYIQIFTADV